MDLNLSGVDFALIDGQVLAFEANACMKFLDQDDGKSNRYLYLEDHIRPLIAAAASRSLGSQPRSGE